MKENVLDVIMYLFEHCVDMDVDLDSDRQSLTTALVGAGFQESAIGKALTWLDDLTRQLADSAPTAAPGSGATRVFSAEEMHRLDVEARGVLLSLEQAGILDGVTRELVIDRAMALEAESIDAEELRWVTLMVLFNQPETDLAYSWMEGFVFDDMSQHLH